MNVKWRKYQNLRLIVKANLLQIMNLSKNLHMGILPLAVCHFHVGYSSHQVENQYPSNK